MPYPCQQPSVYVTSNLHTQSIRPRYHATLDLRSTCKIMALARRMTLFQSSHDVLHQVREIRGKDQPVCFLCTRLKIGDSIAAPAIKVNPLNSCRPKKCPSVGDAIAAPIGLPIKKAKAPMAQSMPIRVPITVIVGQKYGTTTGGKTVRGPEKKPYRDAKTTAPPKVWTAGHTKHTIPETMLYISQGSMIFVRCATSDPRIRPKNETPLKTRARSMAFFCESPSAVSPKRGRKKIGLKYPRNLMKPPTQRTRNGTSFHELVSTIALRFPFVATFPIKSKGTPAAKIPSETNAITRIVHANPRGPIRCWKARR